jgi:hypothetical protein
MARASKAAASPWEPAEEVGRAAPARIGMQEFLATVLLLHVLVPAREIQIRGRAEG